MYDIKEMVIKFENEIRDKQANHILSKAKKIE